jgi:hypothetical protein
MFVRLVPNFEMKISINSLFSFGIEFNEVFGLACYGILRFQILGRISISPLFFQYRCASLKRAHSSCRMSAST